MTDVGTNTIRVSNCNQNASNNVPNLTVKNNNNNKQQQQVSIIKKMKKSFSDGIYLSPCSSESKSFLDNTYESSSLFDSFKDFPKNYKCEEINCKFISVSYAIYLEHIKAHYKFKSYHYKCTTCDFGAETSTGLRYHYGNSHKVC